MPCFSTVSDIDCLSGRQLINYEQVIKKSSNRLMKEDNLKSKKVSRRLISNKRNNKRFLTNKRKSVLIRDVQNIIHGEKKGMCLRVPNKLNLQRGEGLFLFPSLKLDYKENIVFSVADVMYDINLN